MGRYLVKLSLFLGLIIGIGNYLVYLGTGRVPFNDLWQHVKKPPLSFLSRAHWTYLAYPHWWAKVANPLPKPLNGPIKTA